MAKSDVGLPPPMKGGRKGPEMAQDDASIYDKMSKLSSQDQGMGGGGDEAQAAQLVMDGANQLMQAAQIHPALQPIVMQAISILKQGVEGMAGGGAGGVEEMMGGGMGGEAPKKKRVKPPKQEGAGDEQQFGAGY